MYRVQLTVTAKHRRKLASFRCIGGLYHFRIGPVGGSIYLARTPRYSFAQCGNCIDIIDNRTRQTVAFLNMGSGTARQAFDAWIKREQSLNATVWRMTERVAFAAVVLAIAISVVL